MRSRLIISVFASLLLAALTYSSQGQQGPVARVTTDHKVLTNLPKTVLDAVAVSARGGSFRLSDYSGKVLVVNLWATWCPPCRFETPALVKVDAQFRSQGVEIVGLSTEDPEASAEPVGAWVRRFSVFYSVGWATPEVSISLMQGRDALPQTFVVSRSGRIVRRFVGFNRTMTPPQWKLAIEEALNEKTELPKQN